MQYFGGKNRLGKEIASVIQPFVDGRPFLSLFVGSGGVEQYIESKHKIYNDINPSLKYLYRDVMKGYPINIDNFKSEFELSENFEYYSQEFEDLYYDMRVACKDGYIPEWCQNRYLPLLAFGCSFGGKYWGGIARNKKRVDYLDIALRAVQMKIAKGLWKNLKQFWNIDYRDVITLYGFKDFVIYCDPPYANTTGYGSKFDSEQFWEDMRKLSKRNVVFISEYNAPSDFVLIWWKNYTGGMRSYDGKDVIANNKRVESLYVHESMYVDYYDWFNREVIK